jgi:hypothetical protein
MGVGEIGQRICLLYCRLRPYMLLPVTMMMIRTIATVFFLSR